MQASSIASSRASIARSKQPFSNDTYAMDGILQIREDALVEEENPEVVEEKKTNGARRQTRQSAKQKPISS